MFSSVATDFGSWTSRLVYCKNLSIVTGKTVQTKIRLFRKEQSDHGLHCLSFHLQKIQTVEFLA